MDQTILDLYSRLAAIEFMLMHLQKISYRNARMTPEDADRIIAASIEGIKETVFPGFSDPVQSDQFAAAVEERLSTLLLGAKLMLEAEVGRKT